MEELSSPGRSVWSAALAKLPVSTVRSNGITHEAGLVSNTGTDNLQIGLSNGVAKLQEKEVGADEHRKGVRSNGKSSWKRC